jgi:hypothetical protein
LAIKIAKNFCRRCKYKWEFRYESGPELDEWRSCATQRLLEGDDVVLSEIFRYRLEFISRTAYEAGYKVRVVVLSEESALKLQEYWSIKVKPTDVPALNTNEGPHLIPGLLRNFRIKSLSVPKSLQVKEGFEFWFTYVLNEYELCDLLFAAGKSGRVSKIIFLGSGIIDMIGPQLEKKPYYLKCKSHLISSFRELVPRSIHSDFDIDPRIDAPFYFLQEHCELVKIYRIGTDWIRTFGQIADTALWEECKRNRKPFFPHTPETLQPVCPKCSSQHWFVESNVLFSKRFACRLWNDQVTKINSLVKSLKKVRPPGLSRGKITANTVILWCLDFLFDVYYLPKEIPGRYQNDHDLLKFLIQAMELKLDKIPHGLISGAFEPIKKRKRQSWAELRRVDIVLYKWQREKLIEAARNWNSVCLTRITENTVLRHYLTIVLNDSEFECWFQQKFRTAALSPWILR